MEYWTMFESGMKPAPLNRRENTHLLIKPHEINHCFEPCHRAQIQARMFERLFPQDELMSSLVGYWRCNLGTGRVVADQTASAQHAVMMGKLDWKESTIPISQRLAAFSVSLCHNSSD
jgi:hypothetical protein